MGELSLCLNSGCPLGARCYRLQAIIGPTDSIANYAPSSSSYCAHFSAAAQGASWPAKNVQNTSAAVTNSTAARAVKRQNTR